MADDKPTLTTEFEIAKESISSAFKKLEDAAEASGAKIGDALGKGAAKKGDTLGDVINFDLLAAAKETISGIPIAFAAAGVAAVAFGLVVKEAFDFTEEGEKILSVQKQFEALGEGAGVATETLKKGLEDSAKGLVTNTELLQIANAAMINLGTSATKLPEVLDLAREATKALGGDLTERFQAIVQGIETGNQRALRNAGIIIDVEKAYKDFAKTLGLTAGELNKAQQQQALLNAVLEQGGDKFSSVGEAVNPVTLNMKRISVAMTEARESFALFVNQNFGPAFASITESIAEMLKEVNQLNAPKSGLEKQTQDAADARAEILKLQLELKGWQEQLKALGPDTDNSLGSSLTAGINRNIQKLEELNTKFSQLGATAKEVGPSDVASALKEGPKTLPGAPDQAKLTQEQLLAIQGRNDQILALQTKSNQDYIAAEEIKNQQLTNLEQIRLREQEAHGQRLIQLGLEEQQALSQAEVTYGAQRGFTAEQTASAIAAIQADYNAKIEIENNKHQLKMINSQLITTKEVSQILTAGLSSSFQDVGRRLQAGESLFDNFGAGIIGIIGDLAIKLGEALIVQGLALETFVDAINSLLPGSGAAAAAAGVGLVIFGAALKASVGAGGGGSTAGAAGGADAGGGITSAPGATTSFTPQSDLAPSAPGTRVVLNVNGNIIPRDRNFALELSDLVREAFDTQGVVAVTGNR